MESAVGLGATEFGMQQRSTKSSFGFLITEIIKLNQIYMKMKINATEK